VSVYYIYIWDSRVGPGFITVWFERWMAKLPRRRTRDDQ
jgi:hypothetical protein